ncbi:hypothetical protein ACFWIJ_07645 [Streptomyces sp. NPDC127079]|uniref:hypothetical protein n=1 Tax=Streptomyces sp. NPDC127079 TaxID=3347132 RepID=UPI003657C7C3
MRSTDLGLVNGGADLYRVVVFPLIDERRSDGGHGLALADPSWLVDFLHAVMRSSRFRGTRTRSATKYQMPAPASAFGRCVELRTLLLVQPDERQMVPLVRCESREVEAGSGQHGHASEAAAVCGDRQTGVAEPVQVSGDGSTGPPEC